MAQGIGYGKTILFGEHFVVYGIPAIAIGISTKAVVEVKPSKEMKYVPYVNGTIPELTMNAIINIKNAMGIKENFTVYLSGDLPTFGGLGSSAAFCVGLVRALAAEFHKKLTDEQINEFAYEGEKVFHGNPSGVDNTIATYGGAIVFKRGETSQKNKFEKINIGDGLPLVIGVTGVFSNTSLMVRKVREKKEKDEKWFAKLMKKEERIVADARIALEKGDWKKLGKLMLKNQELLEEIGVVIEENRKIIDIAMKNSALGAKVTGGGGGGCCIILAEDRNHALNIVNALKAGGFDAFVAIGGARPKF